MIQVPSIIKEYTEDKRTIRFLSKKYKVSTKKISQILDSLGIEKHKKNNNYGRQLSNDTKMKISKSLIGKSGGGKGRKMTLAQRYNNMRAQLKLNESVDLSIYSDFDKLKRITSFLTNNINKSYRTEEFILAFINKIYNDAKFNKIYDSWIASNKNKWLSPSLDHIVPLSKGGTHDISNLQVLTWFENRCKVDMTNDEWESFKKSTQTCSDYFI